MGTSPFNGPPNLAGRTPQGGFLSRLLGFPVKFDVGAAARVGAGLANFGQTPGYIIGAGGVPHMIPGSDQPTPLAGALLGFADSFAQNMQADLERRRLALEEKRLEMAERQAQAEAQAAQAQAQQLETLATAIGGGPAPTTPAQAQASLFGGTPQAAVQGLAARLDPQRQLAAELVRAGQIKEGLGLLPQQLGPQVVGGSIAQDLNRSGSYDPNEFLTPPGAPTDPLKAELLRAQINLTNRRAATAGQGGGLLSGFGVEVTGPDGQTIRVGDLSGPRAEKAKLDQATAYNALQDLRTNLTFIRDTLSTEGAAVTGFAGNVTQTIDALVQQGKAVAGLVAPGAEIDAQTLLDRVNLAPEVAAKAAVLDSRIIETAYSIALVNNNGDPRLSDRDFERALKQLGEASSPAQTIAVLDDMASRATAKFQRQNPNLAPLVEPSIDEEIDSLLGELGG